MLLHLRQCGLEKMLKERICLLMLNGQKDLFMHWGQLFHITVISETENFTSKINKLQKLFNIWSQRDLSLYGRISIAKISGLLRIGSCLACVYRVMDARGKFGEHERSARVARGDSREQL